MSQPFTDEEIEQHLKKYTLLSAMPQLDVERLEEKLRLSPQLTLKRYTIDSAKFEQYCNEVDYESAFPRYFQEYGAKGLWACKRLEHFISFEVIQPRQGGSYIDVAAANSPVSAVLKRRYGVAKAYKQDWGYQEQIDGEIIRSNASAIPLPSQSLDGIVTHNSWEHFEGHWDRDFLIEAGRLLKVGGFLCLIPLVLRDSACQMTSPSIWHDKYKGVSHLPDFDPRAGIHVKESIRQRLMKFHSLDTLLEDISTINTLRFTVWAISNCAEYGIQQHFLTGERI